MAWHYRKDVTEAWEWCRTCNRLTLHFVSGGRRGRCKEHEPRGLVNGMTKAQQRKKEEQERERREPKLF